MTARRKKPDPLFDISLPPWSASRDDRYIYEMRVTFLLTDAESRRDNPESKSTARRATDALLKHYREAERGGRLLDLDIRVRLFCKDLMAHNGGKLPAPKGGAPDKEHEHFRVAFWINERIEELGGGYGTKRRALREAKARFHLSFEAVRVIYYSAIADKVEWPKLVKAQRGLQEIC